MEGLRVIETLAELKELYAGAFGLDAEGTLWKIDGGTDSWVNIEEGSMEYYQDALIMLPFTLYSDGEKGGHVEEV